MPNSETEQPYVVGFSSCSHIQMNRLQTHASYQPIICQAHPCHMYHGTNCQMPQYPICAGQPQNYQTESSPPANSHATDSDQINGLTNDNQQNYEYAKVDMNKVIENQADNPQQSQQIPNSEICYNPCRQNACNIAYPMCHQNSCLHCANANLNANIAVQEQLNADPSAIQYVQNRQVTSQHSLPCCTCSDKCYPHIVSACAHCFNAASTPPCGQYYEHEQNPIISQAEPSAEVNAEVDQPTQVNPTPCTTNLSVLPSTQVNQAPNSNHASCPCCWPSHIPQAIPSAQQSNLVQFPHMTPIAQQTVGNTNVPYSHPHNIPCAIPYTHQQHPVRMPCPCPSCQNQTMTYSPLVPPTLHGGESDQNIMEKPNQNDQSEKNQYNAPLNTIQEVPLCQDILVPQQYYRYPRNGLPSSSPRHLQRSPRLSRAAPTSVESNKEIAKAANNMRSTCSTPNIDSTDNRIIQNSYEQSNQQSERETAFLNQFRNEVRQGYYKNKSNGLDTPRPRLFRDMLNPAEPCPINPEQVSTQKKEESKFQVKKSMSRGDGNFW